jgi:hypothetical protein
VKARDEVEWEELGQVWWGFIDRQLKRLTPAEALGMNIMNTELAELYGVSMNVAKIIASFLVLEGFKTEEQICVQWLTKDKYSTGIITKINEDGTYDVKYMNGDFKYRCRRSMIKKKGYYSATDTKKTPKAHRVIWASKDMDIFFCKLMELETID